MKKVHVIGGGLAGSEAAWQLAEAGYEVTLWEMRPEKPTGAHSTPFLAELVCSNSLGALSPDKATGLLLWELEQLGSFLLKIAKDNAVPAGGALAVDRIKFAEVITHHLQSHPRIHLHRAEATDFPDGPCIMATGPLTSPALAFRLQSLTGEDQLYFFDALAPIVTHESINHDIVYRASRWSEDDPDGDYLNCPLNEEQYHHFISELLAAPTTRLKSFEEAIATGVKSGAHHFFEGCLPIEIMASRGPLSLAFGPMRPVGLRDPRTGRRPFAVVQLRQDNLASSLYNLVGFQTNLKYGEQERVLRLIPGLENAEFVRLGQMHRNTFVQSPKVLHSTLAMREHPYLFLAGQITGIEGYAGNIASGWVASHFLRMTLEAKAQIPLPRETMLGSLCHYISHAEAAHFQPMKANMGLLPDLEAAPRGKKDRLQAKVLRAQKCLLDWKQQEV